MAKIELYHDNFQNFKRYNIPKAQLVIADIPYNIGADAYASNPMWYQGGDNKNGESKLAKQSFFHTDGNFKIAAIRAEYVPYDREHSTIALGKKYGIDPAYVWRIINGQKRKRLP